MVRETKNMNFASVKMDLLCFLLPLATGGGRQALRMFCLGLERMGPCRGCGGGVCRVVMVGTRYIEL
jgi:hypothetical protein